jgi:hypothetical protein
MNKDQDYTKAVYYRLMIKGKWGVKTKEMTYGFYANYYIGSDRNGEPFYGRTGHTDK